MSNATNLVYFGIALTAENRELINQVNDLIMASENGSGDSGKSTKTSTTGGGSAGKTTSGKAADKKTKVPTMTEMRKIVKAAKEEHGEEFCKDCIGAVDGNTKLALGKALSSVEEDRFEDLKALLEDGPDEEGGEEEDDGLGDDGDGVEVDVEDVKKAVRAYSKENGRDEAKKLLKKHGCASLTQVDDLDAEELSALMDDCV